MWGFRRGFIEHVLAPAPTFLSEDVAILAHAPVRRVVLAHATEYVGPLAADPRLDELDSLHLVGDMELDEDLTRLSEAARAAGLTVLEFRLPRLWPDAGDLFDVLRVPVGQDDGRDPNDFPAWALASPDARRRLASLAGSPRVALLAEDPAARGGTARPQRVGLSGRRPDRGRGVGGGQGAPGPGGRGRPLPPAGAAARRPGGGPTGVAALPRRGHLRWIEGPRPDGGG